MGMWNPDKECDRPLTSEFYNQQDRANRLRKAIDDAIQYANYRWQEWGDRAIKSFEILLEAVEKDSQR